MQTADCGVLFAIVNRCGWPTRDSNAVWASWASCTHCCTQTANGRMQCCGFATKFQQGCKQVIVMPSMITWSMPSMLCLRKSRCPTQRSCVDSYEELGPQGPRESVGDSWRFDSSAPAKRTTKPRNACRNRCDNSQNDLLKWFRTSLSCDGRLWPNQVPSPDLQIDSELLNRLPLATTTIHVRYRWY